MDTVVPLWDLPGINLSTYPHSISVQVTVTRVTTSRHAASLCSEVFDNSPVFQHLTLVHHRRSSPARRENNTNRRFKRYSQWHRGHKIFRTTQRSRPRGSSVVRYGFVFASVY
ncbi:hypothetical protein PILCRDRAFT_747261 [Piloderma croceum F 1598]|uniref:Uncharacterized protein n=1 Tax=Piloderma croceum (strain F 1598) TaxID=765440 RepID=A0A0C3B3U3_PILCF|nr:hypothetical protein PILCRDRAFT_747261 [Piloderma croceum F 1598]